MRVDVKEVLRSKKPGLAKWMPGFVVNYLRRIVHEDEVNTYLENYSHLDSIEFTRATLRDMQIKYDTVGIEKLDPEGRYIFASNHPFGGLDGLMLADKVEEYFGDVKVVVNDLLMNLEPLKSIFIPVNKHGKQSVEYAKLYNDTFASNTPIVTFPAGLCSRRQRGVVMDSEWKHNFVKQAIATQRDIVPVFFEGRLSNFFYRLSNLRTRLGVKANIEMLYLADEMFKQHGKHFNIYIGDPIGWETLKNSGKSNRQMAEEIRCVAYGLNRAGVL